MVQSSPACPYTGPHFVMSKYTVPHRSMSDGDAITASVDVTPSAAAVATRAFEKVRVAPDGRHG